MLRLGGYLATAVIVLLAVVVSGCANQGANSSSSACRLLGPKALAGAGVGALAGAGIGAAASGGKGQEVLAGALIGALVGSLVGNHLDGQDCEAAQMAMRQMDDAKVGQHINWSNPQSGNSGSFVPLTNAQQTASGQVCRKYARSTTLKGGQQTGGDAGTVCRNPDGDWVPVS